MDENQEKPEKQLSDEPQSKLIKQSVYRKISEEELKKIFADHQKCLESEGKDGKIADLSRANLSGANLNRAKLRKANLKWANLSGANLRRANLSRAKIRWADLSEADLIEADLIEADLRGANLSSANLKEAYLNRAYLSWVNLREAELSGADLSGATVNKSTLSSSMKVKGVKIGVNGIWAKNSDSAALMPVTPPGNSMLGPNPDAVIESLKRARRLHGFSMSLVGIIILIATLNLTEIKFPWAGNVKVTPSQFGLLAMPMSIGLLFIVGSFISDALKGARYLQDRSSAMSVGNFPWSLSKYAGEDKFTQFLSFIIRMVMSFHPITYIFILGIWQVFNPIVFYVLSIITFAVSGWVLFLSEQFQKPILFDRRTEEERQDDLAKLAKSVEQQTVAVKTQTKKMAELVDIFKPKENEKIESNDSDGDSSNGAKTR